MWWAGKEVPPVAATCTEGGMLNSSLSLRPGQVKRPATGELVSGILKCSVNVKGWALPRPEGELGSGIIEILE